MTNEKWDPTKKPAPEFRGVAMTYEQFNQFVQMNAKLVEIHKWSIASNIFKSAIFFMILVVILYILYWADINNIGTVYLAGRSPQ